MSLQFLLCKKKEKKKERDWEHCLIFHFQLRRKKYATSQIKKSFSRVNNIFFGDKIDHSFHSVCVDTLQTLPTLNWTMWMLNTTTTKQLNNNFKIKIDSQAVSLKSRRICLWRLSLRVFFFTHRNGDNNWAFDDPPIGGVLIYVPTPAEESASRGGTEGERLRYETVGAATEFLSTLVGFIWYSLTHAGHFKEVYRRKDGSEYVNVFVCVHARWWR